MTLRGFLQGTLCALIVAAAPSLGCTDREEGLLPAGGAEASAVQEARFLRRLYLDLTGLLPADADVAAGLDRLDRDGDSPATRGDMAGELLADPRFATVFVSELENRVFSGGTANNAYALFCPVFQAIDPECAACAPSVDCSGCPCARLVSLAEERASLLASADDIASGQATPGDIERRYAESQIFQLNAGSAEGISSALFADFLGRPAEPDEVKNASAMVNGTFIPGSPVGLIFHRHGENYAELIDIVFASEVYRDAAVNGAFLRYLGREATPEELAFFSGGLDPAAPDVRTAILAVVSSGEYFTQ